ncbi:hypothetical protein EV359DRAFT_67867 [Lentinula novae-zelandiae]|nr:hypothetical protein EV359DRAFT_67867 [Lentinula novae-zelandiae]
MNKTYSLRPYRTPSLILDPLSTSELKFFKTSVPALPKNPKSKITSVDGIEIDNKLEFDGGGRGEGESFFRGEDGLRGLSNIRVKRADQRMNIEHRTRRLKERGISKTPVSDLTLQASVIQKTELTVRLLRTLELRDEWWIQGYWIELKQIAGIKTSDSRLSEDRDSDVCDIPFIRGYDWSMYSTVDWARESWASSEIQVLGCRIITVFLPLPTHTSSSSSPIDKFPPSSWDTWDSDDNDNDDNDGWQDIPIVHTDELRGGLDDEDRRIYHYRVDEEAGSS